MLKANKSLWFEKLFGVYNRNLLKRRFNSLNINNFSPILNRTKTNPLIIYANHSSWWDGLVIFEILKKGEFDSYVLMEEKQLIDLPLFRRLGAFSIVRENRLKSLESLNYIIELLTGGKNKTLLIFPQGSILPNDLRPLKFYNGVSFIIQKGVNCDLVPCSLRYEFLNDYKPEIFVSFGKLQSVEKRKNFNRKSFTRFLEIEMTKNLDQLKSNILNKQTDDFTNIL